MGRGQEGIRSEDCPDDTAPVYPGKKSRNKPNGSSLTKSEYILKAIDIWVKHFDDSDRYHNTAFGNKVTYLKLYLKNLHIGSSEIKEKLLAVENLLAEKTEDENLANSQNLLNNEMEVDMDDGSEPVNTDIMLSRWEREQELEKLMQLSDEEIFGGGFQVSEHLKQSRKYKQREKSFFLSKTDQELFNIYNKLPTHIRNIDEFKERHTRFVEIYMEDNFSQSSSQEILLQLSQTPAAVQSSEAFKERLSHLSFQERSERLVMKNIKDTLKELNKTPEGRKQSKLIIAAVSHPVFGDPGLELDERTRKETKSCKQNLLTGKENTLKLDDHKKRKVFPASVEAIAREHWMENTIPEPAKHRGKAKEADGETLATRYQDKTDKEFFENFKEECKDKVKIEMTKISRELIAKLGGRPETADKMRRLQYAQQLIERFVYKTKCIL